MPKPAPATQAFTAGAFWLNSRLPLTAGYKVKLVVMPYGHLIFIHANCLCACFILLTADQQGVKVLRILFNIC